MIDIVKFVRDFANSNCLHSDEYECDKQEGCYACISSQIAKHDAEVKAETIDALLDEIKAVIFDAIIEIENRADKLKE